jgi:hypothetical protein
MNFFFVSISDEIRAGKRFFSKKFFLGLLKKSPTPRFGDPIRAFSNELSEQQDTKIQFQKINLSEWN